MTKSGDGISEKIEALEKAKKDKDPKAYLAALHSLLDQAGDSTILATPEIKELEKEAIGIFKPIIDAFIKDSLIGIYGYIENMKVEACEKTMGTHMEMNKLEAKLLSDMLKCYDDMGFTRKEAFELIKVKLGKPQNISLSFPTNKIFAQKDEKSKEEIITDFIKLAQEDPEMLLEVLASATARGPFAGGFRDKRHGMD